MERSVLRLEACELCRRLGDLGHRRQAVRSSLDVEIHDRCLGRSRKRAEATEAQGERLDGQVFVFFILTVAAAEAAIGLAILVVLFRNRQTINVTELDDLKG